MSRHAKFVIAWAGIVVAIAYFGVVISYSITQLAWVYRCWEAMIVLSAVAVWLVLLSLLESAEKTTWKIAAIASSTCMMGITTAVHWPAVIGSIVPTPGLPPIDTLAWGLFMGFAFLFSAASLPTSKLRLTTTVCGCLCLLGLAGAMVGNELLWMIAVAGYGIGTPVISGQLLARYRKERISKV